MNLEGDMRPDASRSHGGLAFLAAAARLGMEPGQCAVFEDALSGVAAGRAGHFGIVVGVDRVGQAEQLRANGADIVVTDLAELLEAP